MDDLELTEGYEGFRQFAYRDSRGFLTIGIGLCIEENHGPGITYDQAYWLFAEKRAADRAMVATEPWFEKLNAPRQAVILDMIFQIGLKGLMEFHEMIACFDQEDYSGAAQALLNSKLAIETSTRVKRNAEIIRSGEWPTV